MVPEVITAVVLIAVVGGFVAVLEWMQAKGNVGKLMMVLTTIVACQLLDLLDWTDSSIEKFGLRFWTISFILFFLLAVALKALVPILRILVHFLSLIDFSDRQKGNSRGEFPDHIDDSSNWH